MRTARDGTAGERWRSLPIARIFFLAANSPTPQSGVWPTSAEAEHRIMDHAVSGPAAAVVHPFAAEHPSLKDKSQEHLVPEEQPLDVHDEPDSCPPIPASVEANTHLADLSGTRYVVVPQYETRVCGF
ncbi:hypothetical protein E6O75_ATG07653 [Venturia nashicola]|uniref:Uncharacterized protein n=1 Tax=Venturia nashicola TaxID=86259 RepID=A0A4Z1P1Y3_9PEZI|nr:hypothetical protein E6O75_ATG07653 [Venturia nashicola]